MAAEIEEFEPLYQFYRDNEMAEQTRRIANRATLGLLKNVAKEVIDGKWGDGMERIEKLEEAGYDSAKVQNIVNVMIMEGKK